MWQTKLTALATVEMRMRKYSNSRFWNKLLEKKYTVIFGNNEILFSTYVDDCLRAEDS